MSGRRRQVHWPPVPADLCWGQSTHTASAADAASVPTAWNPHQICWWHPGDPTTGHHSLSDPLLGQHLGTQGILRCFPCSPDTSTSQRCFSTPKLCCTGFPCWAWPSEHDWNSTQVLWTLGFPQTLPGLPSSPISSEPGHRVPS